MKHRTGPLQLSMVVMTLVGLGLVSCSERREETTPDDKDADIVYIRDEDDSVAAFYEPYAAFANETPEPIVTFVTRLEELTGLPREAASYPTDADHLRDAARAFSIGAEDVFGFALDLADGDPTQLDRFANEHLIDEKVREFFEGTGLREDLTIAEDERFSQAMEGLTLPNEPLLYYAMGSFWGEWLVTHRQAQWALFDPLRPIQAFPDMMSIDTTVCMHPFSHVVKKLTDPAGDQLEFKVRVSSSMKRYFTPYLLTASISDAEHASSTLLPREALEARTHERNGDLQQAFEAYVDAIERDPDNARVYTMAVGTAWQLERWDEVESWLEEGLRLAPDHPVLNHNLGVFYAGFPGGMDRAIELLAKAIESDPNYARARITLASCLAERDRIDEAREQASWVVDNDPELAEEAKAFLASLEQE